MEEHKAHQYYQELKNAGSGAAQFKQGLGYSGGGARPPAPAQPPSAAAQPSASAHVGASLPAAPGGAPHVMQPPPGAAPGPQRPPPALPPPPGAGAGPAQPVPPLGFPPAATMPPRGPPPPSHMGRPPYPMHPRPLPGPPPPGYRPPPPPPGYYPPGLGYAMRPAYPHPAYPAPSPPPPPPLPLLLPPRPSPPAPGGAAPPMQPAAGPAGAGAGAGKQQAEQAAAQRRQHEEQRRQRDEEAEEKRQQAVAAAWSAYKSEGGAAYYYNRVTGESKWEKPEGFAGDAERASANPVPVSSEKVKGTEWLEVVCDDGKRYYYQERTGETSWQVPPEVEAKQRGKAQLDPVKAAMLERVKATGALLAPEYQALADAGAGEEDDVSFTEEDISLPPTAPPAAAPPAAAPAPPHALWPAQPRPPAAVPPPAPPGRGMGQAGQAQFHPKFGMLPAVPPPLRPKGTGYGPDGFWQREDAVAAFKELLGDKGIHAFSRWERELPKLTADERFKYLPASERRAAFEEFCREAGASRGKAGTKKAAAGRAAGAAGPSTAAAAAAGEEAAPAHQSVEAAFEQLLDEIQEACSAPEATAGGGRGGWDGSNGGPVGGEPESGEIREAQGGAGAGAGGGWGPMVRWDEQLTLDQLESFWGADPRWRRCGAEQRQQLFDARVARLRQAAQKQAEEGLRALLREQGVGPSSRWSRTKEAVGRDPRYKAVPRERREALFRQYRAELQAAEEAERRQQAARDEREREAQRKLEAERRAAEQRQKAAAHADAVSNYRALLTEVVRDCDASWRESAPRLARDVQGRGPDNPALERGEAERLFREHTQELLEAASEAFLDLLDATLLPLVPGKEEQDASGLPLPLLRFKEAAKALDPDPRFHRLPADLREVRWRRYVDDALYNRDNPRARQRTQRRSRRGGAAAEDAGGAAAGRRPREEEGGGMDKAYAREYLQADAKRLRRE